MIIISTMLLPENPALLMSITGMAERGESRENWPRVTALAETVLARMYPSVSDGLLLERPRAVPGLQVKVRPMFTGWIERWSTRITGTAANKAVQKNIHDGCLNY